MSGKDATLVGCGWRDEEVKRLLKIAVIATVLNEASVDDTARGRVHQVATVVLHEETLRDALVHDDQGDLRLLGHLVVDL